MSLALEDNGLVMNRSCSALQCSVSCSPEPEASRLSLKCIVYTLLLWLRHFFFQCSHLPWLFFFFFCLLWAVFSPCSVSRLVWSCIGLIESNQAFAHDAVATDCRALSLCCPLRSFHWWSGPERHILSPLLRPHISGVCGYLYQFVRE